MERQQKTLVIEACAWCAEAGALLASALRGVPCFTAEDFRQELERNPDTGLYRISDQESGRLVGYVVLRVERYQGGAEGVILAAAGELAGARLYGQVLPVLERMFHGVSSFRVDPCRAGAIRELLKAGYLPTHVTMRKPAGKRASSAPARRGELLEELAAVEPEARGGPDLRATAHRLHKGGSSSSSSQSVQNVDRRLVVGEGAIGLSSDGGTYTLNVLDGGAVSGALELVKASDQATAKTVSEQLGFTKEIFAAGLTVLDKAGKQVEAQTKLVANAFDTARGEGTQKNLIAAAALATVAIVAVKVWGK